MNEQIEFDANALSEIVRARRTVKPAHFSDREVPREIIEELLENANWAPNHGRTEPWRFKVYAGEARKTLSEFLPRLYQETTPADLFVESKLEGLRTNPLKAPYVIAILMKRQKAGKIPEIEEVEAVACAVQNMQLTARAHGLGAFWSTGNQTYSKMADDFFGIEAPDKFLGLLYVGYPESEFPVKKRRPIEDKVEWV